MRAVAGAVGGGTEAAAGAAAAGFGIYVHWPFCLAKCPYCDFNSHVARDADGMRFARALVRELEAEAEASSVETVDSVFLGGGTPSLMPPEGTALLLDAVARLWRLAPGAEITLEANPTSVEAARLAAFRAAGVNRLSMGIQSLRDADLRALGRMHDAAEARAAFAVARATFPRVSFDLIYARQHQTAAAWRAELTEALGLAADHLSLYQLTIEPGTAFAERAARGGLVGLPGGELAADLYDITQELCEAAGLPAYEISNHAVPGAESRHNLVYWRSGRWVGVGPGAHGRVERGGMRLATERLRDPWAWLTAVEATGSGLGRSAALSRAEAAEEYLLMSFRLREGTSLSRLAALGGGIDETAAADLAADGFVWRRDGRIGATARGRPLLDGILARLSRS